MESDTTTAAMLFVIDEDAMGSDSATKVPTQQSTKAYVDTEIAELDVATTSPSITADDAVSGQVTFHRRGYFITASGVRSNTASEVSLLNATWNLAANTFEIGDMFEFRFTGAVLNNTGSDRTVTFRMTVDGSTVWTFTTPAIPTSASARSYTFDVQNNIASFAGTRMGTTGFASMTAAGAGTSANLYTFLSMAASLPTVDVTQVMNVDFLATMSTASSSFSITPGSPFVRIMKTEIV
jgi:hypothetical protein